MKHSTFRSYRKPYIGVAVVVERIGLVAVVEIKSRVALRAVHPCEKRAI